MHTNSRTPVMHSYGQYLRYRAAHPRGPVLIEFPASEVLAALRRAPAAGPPHADDPDAWLRERLARLAGPVAPLEPAKPKPSPLPAGWRPQRAD